MVSVYIGGAFNKYRFIVPRLVLFKTKFPMYNVTFYDSWKNSRWNGGRVNFMHNRAMATHKTISMYNNLGFGVGITFTNPVIDDLHGNDENELLTVLNKSTLNSVAVANDALRDYIRTHYSNIKILRSITTCDNNIDIPLLKELESKYDLICPRYDWVFNPEFYENVDVEKYEILTNDCCMLGCPIYKQHYAEVAKINRELDSVRNIDDYIKIFNADRCKMTSLKDDYISGGWPKDTTTGYSCINMGNKELLRLREIGYRHFKFLGKGSMNKDFVRFLDEFPIIMQGVR